MVSYRCCIIVLLLLTRFGWFELIRSEQRWAWVYQKSVSEADRIPSKSNLLYEKENVPLFSQLMFSWNAFRDKSGYFSFYVQVRTAETKKWGTWHHMMDWGAGVQKSYQGKSDGFSRYEFVRLEVEKAQLADAFRIKITHQQESTFKSLQGFAVTIANYNLFKSELSHHEINRLSSQYVVNVPKLSQFAFDHSEKHRICSPTSCAMLAWYLSGRKVNPKDFVDNVYDHGLEAYGSWPFNTAHVFEQCNGISWIFATRLNSFVELHRQLSRDIPVVVSVRGLIEGAAKPYLDGHLLVVVGWDAHKREVICHDPAFKAHKKVVKRYAFDQFVRAWEKSHRLAYWVEPRV